MLEDIDVEGIRKQIMPVTYAYLANEPSTKLDRLIPNTCGWMAVTQAVLPANSYLVGLFVGWGVDGKGGGGSGGCGGGGGGI